MQKWLGMDVLVSALVLVVACAAEDPSVGGSIDPSTGGSPGGATAGGGTLSGGSVSAGGGAAGVGATPGGGAATPGGGATPGAGGDAGGGIDPSQQCGSIEQAAEVARAPVDIVIALDSSGSMTDEICNVSKNLSTFADAVGKDSRVIATYQIGIDLIFQFVILCQREDPLSGTALAMDTSRYRRIDTRVDSTNALQVLLDRYDTYKDFLRPGSPTHFIVVSDDESDLPAATFKTQMEAKLGHPFYMHAIVAQGGGCNGSAIGTQYLTLADQTGGSKLSICSQDWSALFKELETAVVATAPLACEFDVPATGPNNVPVDIGKVSVVFTPSNGAKAAFPKAPNMAACGNKVGWHYDNETAPKQVRFCPAACEQVKAGGKLAVAFGCAPPPLL